MICFLGFPNFYNKQCAKSHIALWRIFDSVVRVRYIQLECILFYSLAHGEEEVNQIAVCGETLAGQASRAISVQQDPDSINLITLMAVAAASTAGLLQ